MEYRTLSKSQKMRFTKRLANSKSNPFVLNCLERIIFGESVETADFHSVHKAVLQKRTAEVE